MAGVINRAVAAKGVIAFQDRTDPEQFVYFPGSGQAVLGDTLESFECDYYGIGPEPQWVQVGPRSYLDLAGGVVTGKFRFDATEDQKAALLAEIKRIYSIDEPQLVPAILKDSSAQAVFAQGVASLGGGSAKSTFPTQVAVGSSFNFVIDSGNSLFAQLIAGLNRNADDVSAPTVGMNVTGHLELYGEPFEARLQADLKQVWEYVRDQVNVAANLGWFNFTSEYDRIAQELVKTNVIKITFTQGRADSQFGLQLLESTKKVFEAINDKITSGEGMFRFEPNPSPQEPDDPEKSWFASLAPWSVGVNLSFMRNSFEQSISFDETVSFQGIYTIPVASSMNLGVICGPATKDMFNDVTEGTRGCITKAKAEALQARISTEVQAKETQIREYEAWYRRKEITFAEYQGLVAMLNTRMLTEQNPGDPRTVDEILHEVKRVALGRPLGRRVAEHDRELAGAGVPA
jgi:hypothetical protein